MVQSVDRTIQLLEAMKQPQKSFSLAQLSASVGLPPSTTHRMLQTLCEHNYVVRDERAHLYSLGPALISLGAAASRSLDLTSVATPVLQKLSKNSSEDSFLIILSGFRGLVLSHEDGPKNLKIVEKTGHEVELHCGAIRKAILAHQDKTFINEYLRYCNESFSSHPIQDVDALLNELRQIRRDGVALTCGDYIADAVGIGAPVFDSAGRVSASLGIVLPAARLSNEMRTGLKQMVKQSADELSACLGYAPGLI